MSSQYTNEMIAAVKVGDLAKVEELVVADPSLVEAKDGDVSLVLTAIYYGHPQLADFLAERKPDLDIFEATALNRVERVVGLLQQQPELVNAYAPDGFTPLGLAAFFGHQELVDLLLAHGAEVNRASNNAQQVMPLHSAVATQQLEVARSLIAQGADVNAIQEGGFTPIQGAAQNGQLAMVELLLAHGANPFAKNDAGYIAFDLALERSHHAVITRLGDLTPYGG